MRPENQPKAFVPDRHGKPPDPCARKRARKLPAKGGAGLRKRFPFTIRPADRLAEDSAVRPLALKPDPGSTGTGAALVPPLDEGGDGGEPAVKVIALFEIRRRGAAVSKGLRRRGNYRRGKRSANLRRGKPGVLDRTGPAGRLPPSVRRRADSAVAFTRPIMKLVPLEAVAAGTVRFDTRKIPDPEISGTEYRQGTPLGREVRECLPGKFGRKCPYRGGEGIPLQIDHIAPKAGGGPDRVSSLTLARAECNRKKGSRDLKAFPAGKPGPAEEIPRRASAPLRDAAGVNPTRRESCNRLKDTGLPVSTGSGGLAKYNRSRLGIPKSSAPDAARVGRPGGVRDRKPPALIAACCGRGQYQRTKPDRHGFPRPRLSSAEDVHGFRTGDMVRADVPKGRHAGTRVGRVAARKSGSFSVKTMDGVISSSWKHCRVLRKGNGYGCWTEPYRETEKS